MGQASASSSSSSGIDNTGAGGITTGGNSTVMWIVIGLVVIVGLAIWRKK